MAAGLDVNPSGHFNLTLELRDFAFYAQVSSLSRRDPSQRLSETTNHRRQVHVRGGLSS
jgi:hypothetical protein